MADKFFVNNQEFECNASSGDNQYYLLDNGCIAEVEFGDNYPESPRVSGSGSTFITFERNCESPDENPFKNWDELLKYFGVELNEDNTKYMSSIVNAIQKKAEEKDIALLPVWKYEHGGSVYRAAEANPFPDASWDSGVVGFIYMDVYPEIDGISVNTVKNQLKLEVDEYNQWANNELYRYTIYDREGDQIDTSGGYYNVQDVIDTIDDYNDAKPVKDLGCHKDIANCLHSNRKELSQTQSDIER